jgi:gluconate 2-dehydrogenase gamma chain
MYVDVVAGDRRCVLGLWQGAQMSSDSPTTRGAFDRRTALSAGFVATLTALACDTCEPSTSTVPPTASTAPTSSQADRATAAFVPVLVAMAECFLPSDDLGPGAREAELAPFFERAFGDQRLSTVVPLLKRGCAFVMKTSQQESQQSFVALDVTARDDLLQRLANNVLRPEGFAGVVFLRVVLALTLEGFLGDPAHGGNKGGIGWRSVGFSPDSRAAGVALPVLP